MSSKNASRVSARALPGAAHEIIRCNIFFLGVCAALWLAIAIAAASVAHAAGQEGFALVGKVYGSLETASLGREIDHGKLLLPKQVDAHLRFVAHPEVGPIGSIRWRGLEGTTLSVDGDTAALTVPAAGNYALLVTVEVGSGSERRIVSRRITLTALDVTPGDVRARIVYPDVHGQSPVDLDDNLTVDSRDHDAFLAAYGADRNQPAYRALADWNGNGAVDGTDYAAFTAAHASWSGRDLAADAYGGAVLPVSSEHPLALSPMPVPLARAVSEPAGLEGWIEWTLDGAPRGRGAVLSDAIHAAGEHTLAVRLLGREEDSRTLTTYSAAIYDPTRRRLFEPARDLLREGIAYQLEAVTEPAGFEHLVTWRAWTKYGTVTREADHGDRFDVSFANTYGTEDRTQHLILQADDMLIDQHVHGQGQFPASLALELFGALQELSDVVSVEVDQPQGGRRVIEHVVAKVLPVYYQVLDFEIQLKGLQAFVPFRDKAEAEIQAEAARLLATMTDAQLNKLVFIDSEMRMLPADMAVEVGLPARIAAETDADGFLVSNSWVLKWLWNKSQSLLGCFAKGIAGLIVKLIGALHGAIHDGALDADPTLAPLAKPGLVAGPALSAKSALTAKSQDDALATLDAMVDMANVVLSGRNVPNGGRLVIQHVRTQTMPFVDQVLRAELESLGKGAMVPFLDRGTLEVDKALRKLLTKSDAELKRRVFSDLALIAACEALVEAQDGIRQMIVDTVPFKAGGGSAAGEGFDIVGWLWDTIVGLIGCIPDIGALLEKLVGAAHDIAHAPTPAPTGPELAAFDALAAVVAQVNTLAGNPQRGRQLALFVRDATLPAVGEVLDAKYVDMGESHLTELVAIGIGGQQARMTALLDRSDAELNAGLYDNETSVVAYAQTFTQVFGANPGDTGAASEASAANIWNALVRVIKCLSEGSSSSASTTASSPVPTPAAVGTTADGDKGSDKLLWIIEELHDFLH